MVEGVVASQRVPSPTPQRFSMKAVDVSMMAIKPIKYKYPQRVPMEEIMEPAPCLFDDIDDAVRHACDAQRIFAELPVARRRTILDMIRSTAWVFREDFALCAWSETGRGRYEDKVNKQTLAITQTPGVEDLQPRTFTGDDGMTVIDYAPFGVIGAVTPVTNPTATVINNSITVLAGGNGLVFNAHPGAMRVTNRAISVVNQAIVAAGGPSCLVAAVKVPTIPSGARLLTHPSTACNLVTGGPAVVAVALKSGKRSFCAGPGNPPVVVDETANLKRAAQAIYQGASFDNNMICSDEKEVFVVDSVIDKFVAEMQAAGAYVVSDDEFAKLQTQIFTTPAPAPYKEAVVNKDLVGMDAAEIMRKIGVAIPERSRLLIKEVPQDHALVWTEQLMPFLPIVRCNDFDVALGLALKAEHGYKHTSSIYSSNLDNITKMAHAMNTSIFIVNGAHTAGLASGGEGYTSFSIAGTTGEGLTRPVTFVRERRLVCVGALRFV